MTVPARDPRKQLAARAPLGPALVWWCAAVLEAVAASSASLPMPDTAKTAGIVWFAVSILVFPAALLGIEWARRRAGLPRQLGFDTKEERRAAIMRKPIGMVSVRPVISRQVGFLVSIWMLVVLGLPHLPMGSTLWAFIAVAVPVLVAGWSAARDRRQEWLSLIAARTIDESVVPDGAPVDQAR
jgi:hypothetical protein